MKPDHVVSAKVCTLKPEDRGERWGGGGGSPQCKTCRGSGFACVFFNKETTKAYNRIWFFNSEWMKERQMQPKCITRAEFLSNFHQFLA